MIRRLAELTWMELDALDRQHTAVLLAISPLEQHGPHLPIGLDLYGAEYLTERIAEKFQETHPDWDVLVAPALPIGSNAFDMPGGMFSTQRQLRDTLISYLSCHARHGFTRILLASVHGGTGHLVALEEACAVVNKKYDARCVSPTGALAVKYFTGAYDHELAQRLGRPFTPEEADFLRTDWHAGWWETSLMLLICEEMVREGYRDLKPAIVEDFRKIGDDLIRKVNDGQGYLGAPHLATAEFARAMIELLVRDTAIVMDKILVAGEKISPDERSPLYSIPFLRTDFVRQSLAIGAGVLLTLVGGLPILDAVRQGLRSSGSASDKEHGQRPSPADPDRKTRDAAVPSVDPNGPLEP